jgi:ABC-type lipoprotein export system ATPase subunit
MTPYVVCKQVVRAYRVGDHELVALRGIDFEMEKGEWVSIIGPSGAGKSSLLNLLGGLDRPTAGQLMVGDMNLLELRGRKLAEYRLKRVGFLWQQVERNLLRHRSALRNVTLPMMLNGTPFWIRTRQAHELLDAVGMASHAYKHPAQLSGGQQQRVALAVALANHPNLLLADEPTGALDRESSAQVMALFQDLRERYDLTILMVSHDLAIARYADRVLTLRDGALGQDLSHEQETGPRLDNTGRIQLPEAVRSQLVEASHIAVEIRPEGVLLRPENDAIEDIGAGDALLQDAPPQRRARLARLRHLFRRGQGKTA